TSYAAALALFIPLLFAFSFDKTYTGIKRFLCFIVFLIFVGALVLSYTRAAWTGIAAAMIFFLFIKLKFSFRTIFLVSLCAGTFAYIYRTELFLSLKKNKSRSSSDLAVHVKSI